MGRITGKVVLHRRFCTLRRHRTRTRRLCGRSYWWLWCWLFSRRKSRWRLFWLFWRGFWALLSLEQATDAAQACATQGGHSCNLAQPCGKGCLWSWCPYACNRQALLHQQILERLSRSFFCHLANGFTQSATSAAKNPAQTSGRTSQSLFDCTCSGQSLSQQRNDGSASARCASQTDGLASSLLFRNPLLDQLVVCLLIGASSNIRALLCSASADSSAYPRTNSGSSRGQTSCTEGRQELGCLLYQEVGKQCRIFDSF